MSLILSGTDGLSDVDGSAATPAIRGTDANTGIFFPAADTIAFAEGGAEVARFDSSGNFGLGVTPSTWSTGKAQEFNTVGNAVWSTGANDLRLLANIYYNGGYKYATTASASMYQVSGGYHSWYNAASGTAGNTISFTQAMTLNANGVLALQGASTSANGVGITFPATQSASSDANTLDDYEEGTFTPTIVYSGTNTPTYVYQLGRYTKVGRIVQLQMLFNWNENGSTGNVTVGNLPFTSVTSFARSAPSIVSFGLTGLPVNLSVTGIVSSNSTTIALYLNDNAGTTLSATYTDNDQDMYVTVTYEAA